VFEEIAPHADQHVEAFEMKRPAGESQV
jgi:hypothetical protein